MAQMAARQATSCDKVIRLGAGATGLSRGSARICIRQTCALHVPTFMWQSTRDGSTTLRTLFLPFISRCNLPPDCYTGSLKLLPSLDYRRLEWRAKRRGG